MKTKSKIGWHFCRFDTFVKIIESKKIWLSDVVKSNDGLELKLCNSIANRINDKLKAKFLEKENNENELKRLIIDNAILNDLVLSACSPHLVWTFCMCKKSNNLWHWVEYANKLSGVAIGFNMEKLQTKINELNRNNDSVYFNIEEIEYMNKLPEAEIDEIANKVLDLYLNHKTRQNIINTVLEFTSKKKVNTFKDEKEIRIIAINKISNRGKIELANKYESYQNEVAVGCNILCDIKCGTRGYNGSPDLVFKCLPKKDDLVSHIECPLDLSETVDIVKYCKGHGNKEDNKNILKLYSSNPKIKIKGEYISYVR